MEEWELIICFTDHSWTTDYADDVCPDTDSESDVYQSYIERYMKEKKDTDPEIAYVGTYHIENIEDEEETAWRPHPKEFPLAGLQPNEVYEDVEMAKSCHPEVKTWLPVFIDTIKNVIVIPKDKPNSQS